MQQRYASELLRLESSGIATSTQDLPWRTRGIQVPQHLRLVAGAAAETWPEWVRTPNWHPPELWLQWAWPDPRNPDVPAQYVRGDVWKAFLDLGNANPHAFAQKVLRFAKRWGVLGLCDLHHLPASHAVECMAEIYSPDWAGREDVRYWGVYVHWARAILSAAKILHDGGRLQDSNLVGLYIDQVLLPRDNDVEGQKWFISWQADRWLQLAGVRPIFTWGRFSLGSYRSLSQEPRVELYHGGTIFGVLAVQLAFATAARQPDTGLYTCHNCGRPVARARGGRAAYRKFCDAPQCVRVRNRLNQRDRRAGIRRWRHSRAKGQQTDG
jgi:hypothetical protein